MTKTELRTWAKKVRAGLPIKQLSKAACVHLVEFLRFRNPAHILLYSAFGTELDPSRLPGSYRANYYLPRVGEQLHIHLLTAPLIQHSYGMLEPSPGSPEVDPAILEAILVPGLAFDRNGYRIGYGKGYYDRFLSQLRPEVLTIGLVPEALIVQKIVQDPWDIPVQFLATELSVRPSTFSV